jgi:hypothetical protein
MTPVGYGPARQFLDLSCSVRLELHCHSTCSDGSLEPEQLAQRLLAFGPELACLTDHDTTVGHERFAAALGDDPRGRDVRVLRGLELTCKQASRTIHLLMWGVVDGPGRDALELRLADQHRIRRERIVEMCDRLTSLGVALDPQPILAAAIGRTPGRPDIAKALVESGACSSMRVAFDRWLRDGGPAHVQVDSVSLAEGLALGRAAGARMALAHPHTLRHYAVVRELFIEHRAHGLEGIEAFYGQPSLARAEPWLRLARELDLVVTAGSDFHGDALTDITEPGISLPIAHAARLREWLAAA